MTDLTPGTDLLTEIDLTPERRKTESGYVIAMTALLLVPLMVFAAFAVDVGSWYAESAKAQRAADASALAAVVYMPNTRVAHGVAIAEARKNGYISSIDENGNAVAGGNSVVTLVATDPQSVFVTVSTDADTYFSGVILSDVPIARTSEAKFILPVPMGNPTSGLGTGDLAGQSDGIWLAINHNCTGRPQGDPFSPAYFGGSNTRSCPANANLGANPIGPLSVANGGADFEGYVFVADIPAAAVGQTHIEIRNPGDCDEGVENNVAPDLLFEVFDADDTLVIASDNLDQPPVFSRIYTTANGCPGGTGGSAAGNGGWVRSYTLPAPPADPITGDPMRQLYYIRIAADRTLPGDGGTPPLNQDNGINIFSLRLVKASGGGICRNDTDAGCPNIYAQEWLPIYRPVFDPAVSSRFFLAEIGEEHAGKTLEITLFDPGEGMNNLQILDPHDASRPFQFRRQDCTIAGLYCGSGGDTAFQNNSLCGVNPCLDVDGVNYNDNMLQLQIDLDASYTCDGGDCWWRVQYTPNICAPGEPASSCRPPTDRTTWKVRVIGDPIRLTE